MGKEKENYNNVLIFSVRSEKSSVKMKGSGCFTSYFKDICIVCVCLYICV